jgi:hypothetical protein
MMGVVEHSDGRAGMEAISRVISVAWGLAVIHKHLPPAQKMVVLLVELAQNMMFSASGRESNSASY